MATANALASDRTDPTPERDDVRVCGWFTRVEDTMLSGLWYRARRDNFARIIDLQNGTFWVSLVAGERCLTVDGWTEAQVRAFIASEGLTLVRGI